jgi:hypothetical protein
MSTLRIAVALLAAALALLFGAGCGTKSTSSTSQTKPETKTTTKTTTSHNAEKTYKQKACGDLPVSTDRAACRDSYAACAASAKAKVQAYYMSKGPDLYTIARSYANGVYGSSEDERLLGGWQAGFGGCEAALLDEYDHLYR